MSKSYKKFQLKQSNTPNRKKIYLGVGLLVIALALVAGYFVFANRTSNTTDGNTNDPTVKTAKTEAPVKTQQDSGSQDSSATSQDIPSSSTLGIAIDSFGQASGIVTSKATVAGAASSGSCVFSFTTTDGKPVVKEVASTQSGSMQACTVAVSEVEFDKIGSWNLAVTFYKDNTKTTATQDVQIN
jgi:hypothetical protein